MKKHKVYLQDLLNEYPESENYQKFYTYVMELIRRDELVPMKNAKSNGWRPALPLRFWKYEE